MKTNKFSFLLVIGTISALLYVHQQVQLLTISYEMEQNKRQFVSSLDRQRSLVYNITKLKSPVHLENSFLSANGEFAVSERRKTITVASSNANRDPVILTKRTKRASGFLKIFGRPKEAFAKTVK